MVRDRPGKHAQVDDILASLTALERHYQAMAADLSAGEEGEPAASGAAELSGALEEARQALVAAEARPCRTTVACAYEALGRVLDALGRPRRGAAQAAYPERMT